MKPASVRTSDRACLLRGLRVPADLLDGFEDAGPPDRQGFRPVDVGFADDVLRRPSDVAGAPMFDGRGHIALPGFVDGHVHLDKTMTIDRTGPADGTLGGAVALMSAAARGWSAEDFAARMRAAADRAASFGTVGMRTHIDTASLPDDCAAWQAARVVRTEVASGMRLQIVALSALARADASDFDLRCRQVAEAGGILGAFVGPGPVVPEALVRFLKGAARHGLDVDFHVDETLDPAICNIAQIADVVLRTGFGGRVVAGHACSLSVRDTTTVAAVSARIAGAGITLMSLPATNAYLMDRRAGRTPRRRGLAPVHELRAAGVPVAFASDNVGDAFYPFGDYDMLRLFGTATVAAHLDQDPGAWIASIGDVPARAMGVPDIGRIAPGGRGGLVLVRASGWYGLPSSPLSDRIVLTSACPSANLAGLVPATDTEPVA